jgi:hypothetical protein
LRKLADLRAAGVLSDVEHRERKIEVLGDLVNTSPGGREDILHDLLALRVQGVLEDEDIQFVKELGA